MAGKPRNRFELRRQYEAAEPPDPMEDESDDNAEVADDEEAEVRPKKKAKAPAKKKVAKAKPAKAAARVRVVWQVVNDAFKTIATFEYAQKEAAEAKAAEMTAKGKGVHFLQRVKEAMPDDAPGLGASIPRAPAEAPAEKAIAKVVEADVEDEEIDNDANGEDFEEEDDDDEEDDDESDDG